MLNQYIFSGSLPEEATTYVTREADSELYQGLTEGKFCYVLNSRQSGKSSLRVRTMRRLRDDGVECAAIDLSAGGIQNVPPEQWYADLIDTLIENFDLDVDFGDWWSANQLNSLVTRFRKFIEDILLVEVQENIVIFIDEIDSVLSLNFPTDDFFAFIRSCYNQRADNPNYNRLTFCLLGVASPSNLISDKKRTPFNIGKAITLKGFQLHEVSPLEKGLQGRYSDSHAVMKDILYWTGGQPFLTQKLCQFMVEESSHDNPRSVEQVVKARIIENWESQDEPEHLRTIRDRILRDSARAGYLLELYQQIRDGALAEVTANDTLEQSELQLSGLVVRQQNKLRIYNPIYREVFNPTWIETQLRNLRPYSESLRFWVASEGKDESRLLRGRALKDALEWSQDKSLNYQDREFLSASQAKEKEEAIAVLEKEAQLERERKDREAVEKRNLVLSEANNKAKRRIRNGTVVLILAVLGALSLGGLAVIEGNKALEAQTKAKEALQTADNANKKAKEALQTADNANKKAKEEQKKVKDFQNKTQELEKIADDARQSAQEATERAKVEQKKANDANQKATAAIQKAKNAQEIANDALQQAESLKKELASAQKDIDAVQQLSKLAGELRNENLTAESDDALRQAGLSFRVNDHNLKQAMLFASMSQAYQSLAKEQSDKDKSLKLAEARIDESLKYLNKQGNNTTSPEKLQIQVLAKKVQGNLLANKKEITQAIESYKTAFNLLKQNPKSTSPFTKDSPFITSADIEFIHRNLIDLLTEKNAESELRKQVEESLTQHLYAQLEYLLQAKNWSEADGQTDKVMLYLTKREKQKYVDIENFSCSHLQRIDKLWVSASSNRFGFSVQKEIYLKTGNKLGITLENPKDTDYRNYLEFAKAVGWYNEGAREYYSRRGFDDVRSRIKDNPHLRGTLPYTMVRMNQMLETDIALNGDLFFFSVPFFSRIAACKL